MNLGRVRREPHFLGGDMKEVVRSHCLAIGMRAVVTDDGAAGVA